MFGVIPTQGSHVYLFLDVLITGICDSGKTTILSQLVSGKTGQTYTSMNHNRFSLPVENKAAVELVDVPGSDRVRGQVKTYSKFCLRKMISPLCSGY